MAYVSVPKDLSKVESKFIGNFTKRQTVCFGCGAILGLPVFFLLKSYNASTATLCMIVVMLPFFLVAMYEKNGLYLEKIIRNYVNVKILRPKDRPYKTNNLYSALEKQAKLDKEVKRIVSKKGKAPNNKEQRSDSNSIPAAKSKTQKKRKKADTRGDCQSKGD